MNEVKITKPVTEGQKALIAELSENITAIMVVNMAWATEVTTTAEAAEITAVLKAIRNLVKEVKAMKAKLTTEQIEAIRANISAKPTMKWVNAARKKLNHIKFS